MNRLILYIRLRYCVTTTWFKNVFMMPGILLAFYFSHGVEIATH